MNDDVLTRQSLKGVDSEMRLILTRLWKGSYNFTDHADDVELLARAMTSPTVSTRI